MAHPTDEPGLRRPGLGWNIGPDPRDGFDFARAGFRPELVVDNPRPSRRPPPADLSFTVVGEGYSLFYGQPDQPPPSLWAAGEMRERLAARYPVLAPAATWPMTPDHGCAAALDEPGAADLAGFWRRRPAIHLPRLPKLTREDMVAIALLLAIFGLFAWQASADLDAAHSPTTPIDLRGAAQP